MLSPLEYPHRCIHDGSERGEPALLCFGWNAGLNKCDAHLRPLVAKPGQVVDVAAGWQKTDYDATTREDLLVARTKLCIRAALHAGRQRDGPRRPCETRA